MTYLVLSYCPDTSLLQDVLEFFETLQVDGLSERIEHNPNTGNYLFDMFKEVKYSKDGSQSVGILEVFPQYFNEEVNLFDVINSKGTVLEVLASGEKYKEDVYDNLDEEGILKIRRVIPMFIESTNEEGETIIEENSYRFAGLA